MLVNIWNKISIYCLNHETLVPMEIMSNTKIIKTPFYACSSNIEEKHDELVFTNGIGKGCPNRINLDDYQNMILHFIDIVEREGIGTDFTNYSFYYKGARQKLFCKVLKFTDNKIKLGVKNVTILGDR